MDEDEDHLLLESLSVSKLGEPYFSRNECELLTRFLEDQQENRLDSLSLHQLCTNLIRNRICSKEFIGSRPAKKWIFLIFRLARTLFRDKSRIATFHSVNQYSDFVQVSLFSFLLKPTFLLKTFRFIASRFLRSEHDWNVTIVNCLNVTQKLIDNGENAQKFVDCNLEDGVLMLLATRQMTVLQHSLEILGRLSDWSNICRANLLCVSLLRILSFEEQAREQIRIYDGVPTLLGLLSIKNSRLQWHVAWTLAQLAEQHETSLEIAQLGGISLIFSAISNPKPPGKAVADWVSMLNGLTALLAQLAQQSSNQQMMSNANGVYILGKLLAIRKQVVTEEPIDSWLLLQCSIFRVLRLMYTFERSRQLLKKVLPLEIFEKFVDVGNYNSLLTDYDEIARMYDTLIEENIDIMKDWEAVNERRQAVGEVGEYELLDQLGAGAFGCVYTVRKKAQSHSENPAKLFALKEIFMTNLNSDRESDKSFGDMISEVKIIKQQLRHPNIVRYRRIFVENHRLYIVMDLIQGSSLRDLIITMKEKKSNFEEKKIWAVVVQMMLALRYLHKEKQIVHRDLKPNNIMMTTDRVVITDFGLAKQKGPEYLKSAAGTIIYSCPEIVQNLPYGEKADIWSFGCCVYEMCHLKPAFHSTNMLTLAMQIVEAKYDELDEMWSEDLKSLITSCLAPDQAERPDILKVSGMCGSRLLEYLDDVARQQATTSDMTASFSNYNNNSKFVDDSPSSLNSSTSSYKRPGRPKIAQTGLLPPINPAPRRNHSMSAGETPRMPFSNIVTLPRITNDKYSMMFPSAPSAIPNRRRVQTCSSEHPARSSSSTELKVTKQSDGLTVSSNALRQIQDPVLTILNQIHRIMVITDKESVPTTMNHQRRLVEMFRKNLLGRDNDAVQMKTHLRKLAAESPEEINMNLGFSDFRPVLVQSHINGYQKDQKVTKITYEQLSACIECLLVENPPTCTPQDSCSCYSGSSRFGTLCQYASSYNNYICCYSTNTREYMYSEISTKHLNECGANSSPQISASGQVVSCSTNSNCASGYQCNNGVCCPNTNSNSCSNSGNNGCLTGQVLVNGQCYNSVNIGSACQMTQQCTGGSQCQNGMCQCISGYVNVNQQCVISNGLNCQLGTVSYNSQCITLASPGQSCVTSSQCIDNSLCNNGVCSCNNNYQLVYGYCVPFSNGNCQNTQTLVNNQCVLLSIVGETCIANQQCVGGAICNSGTCRCQTGSTAMYGYCISSSSNSCNSNQVAINGLCYNTVQVGGSCSFSQQCLNQAVCTNNICVSSFCNIQCNQNQVCISNQCYNYVSVGSQCTGSQQCLSNSQCTNGFCQCPQGTQLVNGVCTSNNNNGGCQNNQVSYNGQCYNTVSIGSQCVITQQCLGNSQCLNSFCQCPSGSSNVNGFCQGSNGQCGTNQILYNGQCYNTVSIGNRCTITQQCLGNSQCMNSICQCPSGSNNVNGFCQGGSSGNCNSNQVSYNGQCYNTVSIGSQCMITQQCLGNSQCINSFCQCPSGTNNVNGFCQTTSTANLCSAGQTVQLDNTNQPINCLVSTCPTNSFCQYSASGQRYVCCRSTSGKKK
ncbi:LOW QUALITY PROTEIN: Protein CBR-NEKL-4, partial [Caenorhabditis briggsae]